jgi:[lysine-biosynthesis-protein LysW]--L-2-aminoadipate ligase
MRWEEKALYEACRKRNIEFSMINAKNLSLELTSDDKPENIGDIVLQRCVEYFCGLYLTAIIENYGIRVINSFKTLEICGNKLLNTLIFKKHNIPTPRTFVAFDIDSALEAFEKIGYPAILKPIIGSWGRLVSLINDRTSAIVALEHREMMFPLYHVYYIQEMIKRPPRDIRVFVIGDDVPVAIYRINENDWRTNTARGGRVERCPVTSEIRELALRAAEAVGGGVFGVDMMERDGEYIVHEINGTVEFKNTVPATGVDIPGMIIDYAIKEAKK